MTGPGFSRLTPACTRCRTSTLLKGRHGTDARYECPSCGRVSRKKPPLPPGPRRVLVKLVDERFPAGEPDDERLVEKVAEAIMKSDLADPGADYVHLARAAVAAIAAYGGDPRN